MAVQQCEIVHTVVFIQNPQMGAFTPPPSPAIGFCVEVHTQGKKHVLASSKTFMSSFEEMKSLRIQETHERRAAVEDLKKQLIKQGWKPTRKGSTWYSYCFER